MNEDKTSAVQESEFNARKRVEVFEPLKEGTHSKPIVDTWRALTWKMVDGKEDVKTRLIA